ncbi:MAG: flagellar hook-basal body complex protein, partial [Planctomycetes bacterium]|nr:flagellar hook-basal body complex protein [Planctomycetota bacterium]
ELSTAAEVIRTDTLSDSNWTAPPAGTSIASLAPPNLVGPPTTTHVGQVAGNTLVPGDTYHYKIAYADGALGSTTGTEGIPSTAINLAGVSLQSIAGGDAVDEDTVYIDNIPSAPPGTFTHFRIYRSTDGGTSYNYAGEDVVAATNFTDDGGTTGAVLDETRMTGNYSYYITFANSPGGPGFGTESRPAPMVGPLPVSNGRVTLEDLPVDASGQYTVRRIYRNLSDDDASFHFIGEILDSTTPNLNWTDKATDAMISGNTQIDLDGPRATSSTLLTELLRRDGAVYENVFTDTGSLEFTGRKGGRALQTKSLTVDNTTTVLDMLNFMEEALGIRRVPGPDPLNPIPPSIAGVGDNPGGSIVDGRIQLVGNNGVDNALEIGLSGMQLYTATGQENINLPFGSSQSAVGESAVTDFLAYDSLGIPLQVRLTTVLESRDSTSTTYRWFADSPNNDPQSGVDIAVGTGLITFDGEGNFLSATEDTVSIDRRNVSSASPLEFDLDFSQLSGLATETSSLAVSRQDGSSPGVLTSFIIGEDGRIRGVFSNGMTRDLAQIRLARFSNPSGLEQRGQNLFATGVNSGLPIQGNPGEQGIGDIIAGALELSNTDIGGNLIDLILASTMYRGNTRVITTAQQMFDELLALRR